MKFIIGCNYWGSKHGTDMWRKWDAESVRNDFKALSEYGVEVLRVFPNWREFQPVISIKTCQGGFGEYLCADETRIDNEYAIDYKMMERFSLLCDFANEFNIKLNVGIVTGWMSGRLFVPPVLEGKNLINDSEALMLQSKFVKGFVRYFKDRPEIISWELGNECNCMGEAQSRSDAYVWTSLVRNAIYCEDQTRPIISGMHSLDNGKEWPGYNYNRWTVQDQGEICDILTPHPYPSPTVYADREACNTMRPLLSPAAHVVYYSGIGKKPAIIQETSVNIPTLGNEDMSADWLRGTMLNGWANGSLGLLWWCAHEHLHIVDAHPYNACMIERQLGILNTDLSPKKVALEMKRMGQMLHSLPFEELPPRDTEIVVCMPNGTPAKSNFLVSFVMAKQTGFDVTCSYCEQDLPESQFYIVPSCRGWSPFPVKFWLDIRKKAENGATVLFSDSEAAYTEIDKVFGFNSLGRVKKDLNDSVIIDGHKLDFRYGDAKILINPLEAKVLLRAEGDGNPLLTEHSYGKGKIYFLNFAIEEMLGNGAGKIDEPDKYPYYLIYKKVFEKALKNRLVTTENPYISITQHKFDEKNAVIVAINSSDKTQKCGFNTDKVKNIEVLYGNTEELTKCEAVIMKVEY